MYEGGRTRMGCARIRDSSTERWGRINPVKDLLKNQRKNVHRRKTYKGNKKETRWCWRDASRLHGRWKVSRRNLELELFDMSFYVAHAWKDPALSCGCCCFINEACSMSHWDPIPCWIEWTGHAIYLIKKEELEWSLDEKWLWTKLIGGCTPVSES